LYVGLISDTHDNVNSIRRAVEVFNSRGVELVLHAGDYVSPFTALAFKGLRAKLIGVYGNVDGDIEALKRRYEEELKAELKGYFAELSIGGVNVALIHGVHGAIVRALAKSGDYAVVVHGHTHRARSEVIGSCLVVNPGEACGYVNGVSTVAVLSLPGREVEHVKLK